MTTVAFDGRFLAADSMIVDGGTMSGYQRKIFETGWCYAVGIGDVGHVAAFQEWVENGADPDNKPDIGHDDKFTGVLFDKDTNEIKEYGDTFSPYIVTYYPCTWGTGSDIALAAMDLGLDAKEAVAFAAYRDLHTGGDIDCFEVIEEK